MRNKDLNGKGMETVVENIALIVLCFMGKAVSLHQNRKTYHKKKLFLTKRMSQP